MKCRQRCSEDRPWSAPWGEGWERIGLSASGRVLGRADEMPVHRFGRELAVLHGLDRQIEAFTCGAVAAGPDLRKRGTAFVVDDDAPAIERENLAIDAVSDKLLSDRLQYHVGLDGETLARVDEAVRFVFAGALEFHAGHMASVAVRNEAQ